MSFDLSKFENRISGSKLPKFVESAKTIECPYSK